MLNANMDTLYTLCYANPMQLGPQPLPVFFFSGVFKGSFKQLLLVSSILTGLEKHIKILTITKKDSTRGRKTIQFTVSENVCDLVAM